MKTGARFDSFLLLLVAGLLALGSAGCSIIGFAIGSQVDRSKAIDCVVTPGRIDSIPVGEDVTVYFKNGYSVRGTLARPGLPEARVYIVWPQDFPQVSDSLVDWTPIAGQRITVYNHPSLSVYYKGVTDYAAWHRALNLESRTVRYLTPKQPLAGERFLNLLDAVDSRQIKYKSTLSVAFEDSVTGILWQRRPAVARTVLPLIGLAIDIAAGLWAMERSRNRMASAFAGKW